MSAPIDRKAVARAWIGKAEADFKAMRLLLASGKDCPTPAACFHAQQCVEKYLKAVLCLRGVDFPRIHDIGGLASLLPPDIALPLSAEEQEKLTEYAVDSRYPGMDKEIDLEETARALAWMETARTALRAKLFSDLP